MWIRMGTVIASAVLACAANAQSRFVGERGADYPTAVVIDYAIGCMASNGQTRDARDGCACSIDVISTLLPYEAYEAAETYLSLGRIQGERGVIFRTSEPAHEAVDRLRRAQIEAELRCF